MIFRIYRHLSQYESVFISIAHGKTFSKMVRMVTHHDDSTS